VKILEFGKFYPPSHGGIESLLRAWSEGFVRQGADVDCVVANPSPRTVHEELNGVRVHRLASYGTLFRTSVCPAYLTSARRYRADLWHAHFPNPLADAACLFGGSRTPLLLTYHCDALAGRGIMRAYEPLRSWLLNRAEKIVVATPNHIEFSPALQPYREKCEVIPFGIDPARFDTTPGTMAQAARFREEAKGRPILLTVGRLVSYKGHYYLLAAARNLDVEVWIVGAGPLEAETRELADRFGISNRVRFWGSMPDEALPAIFHACDIFVLPSVNAKEAFGLVQIEAMACGKPVVSCALKSGVPYVNQNGSTGVIVPPEDVVELTAALDQLLRDPPLRARMGAAGKARVAVEFDERVMLERYWNCVRRLADR
jgi:glycosyltransferase involved in cell wall biosynthesis